MQLVQLILLLLQPFVVPHGLFVCRRNIDGFGLQGFGGYGARAWISWCPRVHIGTTHGANTEAVFGTNAARRFAGAVYG